MKGEKDAKPKPAEPIVFDDEMLGELAQAMFALDECKDLLARIIAKLDPKA